MVGVFYWFLFTFNVGCSNALMSPGGPPQPAMVKLESMGGCLKALKVVKLMNLEIGEESEDEQTGSKQFSASCFACALSVCACVVFFLLSPIFFVFDRNAKRGKEKERKSGKERDRD